MLVDAAAVLTRLLAGGGRTLESFEQTDVEPVSEGFLVGYTCAVRSASGSLEQVTIYVNTSAGAPIDEHTVVVEGRAGTVAAWVYPQDPSLPALRAVSYPEAASVVLSKFGVEATGARLRTEAYRPGKRAVLRIETDDHRWFAKVVHPSLAESLHHMHEQFRDSGVSVPRSHGFSEAGLVLLDQLEGLPAIDVFDRVDRKRFAAELEGLTAQIARVPTTLTARESLAKRADWYADRMAETAPKYATRARKLAARVTQLYDAGPPKHLATIHGDLHLGQIFVDELDPSRILGILDIDTAGLGDKADDAGALYGHVVVSSLEDAKTPARASALSAFAAELHESWHTDPRTAAVAAIHLVGHALAAVGRSAPEAGLVVDQLLTGAETLLARHGSSPPRAARTPVD